MPSVDVGIKFYAIFADLSQACQRKYLKSAAVCKYGAVPCHKFMQAAHIPHQFISGSEVQMICVGQLNLTADGLEIRRGERTFYSGSGTDIHEYRRLHSSVRRFKLTSAGAALLLF